MKKKFYCFPKHQNLMILYDNPKIFKTSVFKSLYIQMSPKNSFLMRLRKTIIGHWLFVIFFIKKNIKISVPCNDIKIAYCSNNKKVLFKLDNKYSPLEIFNSIENSKKWIEKNYLGLPLIIEYSKKELNKKWELIEKALKQRWEKLNNKDSLHGDFTHLNILISKENKITEIDNKTITNSILFDHFYFYSYLSQCINLCKTIQGKDKAEIQKKLNKLIKDICVFDNENKKLNAINSLLLKDAKGLHNAEKSFKDFKRLFI